MSKVPSLVSHLFSQLFLWAIIPFFFQMSSVSFLRLRFPMNRIRFSKSVSIEHIRQLFRCSPYVTEVHAFLLYSSSTVSRIESCTTRVWIRLLMCEYHNTVLPRLGWLHRQARRPRWQSPPHGQPSNLEKSRPYHCFCHPKSYTFNLLSTRFVFVKEPRD